MKKTILLSFFIFFLSGFLHAQIEKVIVETYYIADSSDAADTTHGKLEEGSVTYRVYVDLKPGSKLKKIYGDANHILRFESTSDFYNHLSGKTFAKDFTLSAIKKNITVLDTWITLGKLTTGSKNYGILKPQDKSGNLIAGPKNDSGLLSNNSQEMGTPLTISDGIDTMTYSLGTWSSSGIVNPATQEDSTIFGSLISRNKFISNDAFLKNATGMIGVVPDSNQVLVAQLTTKGELSFELNIEVDFPDPNGGADYITKKYVANDSILLQGEEFFRGLKYPYIQTCGCPDPNYLEYKQDRDCDRKDLCTNRIVFGCMDTMACNYDPTANVNLAHLCCYPGYCNDRDLDVLCPHLTSERKKVTLNIFPNPAEEEIDLLISSKENRENCKYIIYDVFGKKVIEKYIGFISGNASNKINLSSLPKGIYILRFLSGEDVFESKTFLKK